MSPLKEYTTERFQPAADQQAFRPFRLVNDRLGVAHTIHAEMSWARISREVLGDGTNSSALAAVVKGQRRSINGWRCEWPDERG